VIASLGLAIGAGRRVRSLFVCVMISGVVHYAAFEASKLFVGAGAEAEEYRIKFISPPPIMKKSFDLAKRPEISEVQMEMLSTMAQPQAPTDIQAVRDVSALGADLLSAVSPSTRVFGTFSGAKAEQIEFEQVQLVSLTETAAPVMEAMSMKQELLSVGDLDVGRYQAVIIQDPTDKRKIRGFFKMTMVDYDLADKIGDRFPTAVDELMRYIRDHTQINAQIEGVAIELSSRRLFDAPFIYITGGPNVIMKLSEIEIENLGEYLRGGGFLYAEDVKKSAKAGEPPNGGRIGTPFDRQMKDVLKQALGNDYRPYKIPKSHSLYAAFYDFPDGPPMGGAAGGNVFDLEGIDIRGRLAVVFSDLNISWYWGDTNANGRERGLQFGVNLIVFALTQPGGIANVTQYTG